MKSSLPSGARLGRFEIRERLGVGGMGEVYLARDLTLDRHVALKILPEDVAANERRMSRFVLEAKAASALNHPNILTIHEIGTEPGAHFIATEFIDGTTLRHHQRSNALTLTEAIEIAIQVASALATAHAAGIIHRDIKPENIMVRKDGIVKVLDFGLAKLTERWRADEVDDDAATKAMAQTEPGVVLGTTAYMSPEQARAQELDTRTDIWSLGVVLYEMVVGRTPFKSETASDTSAAILKSEPAALSQQVAEVPAELERIVKKALQKDREERYQVVKDLLLDLKSLKRELDLGTAVQRSGAVYSEDQRSLAAPAQTTAGPALHVSTQSSTLTQQLGLNTNTRWVWLVALLLMSFFAGGAWYWWRYRHDLNKDQFASLSVKQLISRKHDLGETGMVHARFSPDGKFVAYASIKGGNSSIWLKQVNSGEPFRNHSDQETAFSPIWSPDGQQLAFLSKRDTQSGIWNMAAFGGSPALLKPLEIPSRRLIAWSRQGKIYFEMNGNLWALDVASQQYSPLTQFDSNKPLNRNFAVSPDEERIAYTDDADGQIDVWVMPRSGGSPVRVTNDTADDNDLVWTPDGQRLLYSSNRNGIKQIFLATLDGREPVQLTVNDSDSNVLDISPDGTKILYATARDESDLWSVKLDRPKESQLTSDIGIELWPDAAPDGKWVAFQATHATTGAKLLNCLVLAKSLTSDTAPIQLAPDGFAPRWSPDGKELAFLRYNNGPTDLWLVHPTGGDAKPLTNGGLVFGGYTLLPYNRSQTQDFEWSPDSSQLVYCANTSGVHNVWQTAADGSGPKQLSDNVDPNLRCFSPSWSPDGQRVAWLALSLGGRDKKASWSVWLASAGKGQQIFQSDSVLGLVGWSTSGQELIVKSSPKSAPNVPVDVHLFSVDLTGGAPRSLAELKNTYFQNIQLAPARHQIAFVSRQEEADNLQLIPATGGAARTIVTSNDPRVYLSGLAWAPDSKTIYYGKQASWSMLSMIDNFK